MHFCQQYTLLGVHILNSRIKMFGKGAYSWGENVNLFIATTLSANPLQGTKKTNNGHIHFQAKWRRRWNQPVYSISLTASSNVVSHPQCKVIKITALIWVRGSKWVSHCFYNIKLQTEVRKTKIIKRCWMRQLYFIKCSWIQVQNSIHLSVRSCLAL